MKVKNKQDSELLFDLLPQDEIEKRILNERATYLSKPLLMQEDTSQVIKYVRFKLGEYGYYGIPFVHIKEVMLNILPTRVPHTPDCIAGIINRGGALLSVVDLKPFFNMHKTADEKKSHLMVIAVRRIAIALQVDEIEGSDAYDPATLDGALALVYAIKPKYIIGLHRGTTAILNVEELVSDLQLTLTPLQESKEWTPNLDSDL